MSAKVKEFRLRPIAETTGPYADFKPYVASINNEGLVAFQATLKSGGTGLFVSDGTVTRIVGDSQPRDMNFQSHPDINSANTLAVYATLKHAGQAVVRIKNSEAELLCDTGGEFAAVGPLGPTINESGAVAFRAESRSDEAGIYVASPDGSIVTIAETKESFKGFHGLPVINSSGQVAFRADLKDGSQAIYSSNGETLSTIATTGERFSELGLFPDANDRGVTVMTAKLKAGGAGVFIAEGGKITSVVETNTGFESFRGAVINNRDDILFYATPKGGQLGIYSGPEPNRDKILALGDPLCGSSVSELALNPVSLNDSFQVALRVELADGRQMILRADRVN